MYRTITETLQTSFSVTGSILNVLLCSVTRCPCFGLGENGYYQQPFPKSKTFPGWLGLFSLLQGSLLLGGGWQCNILFF